jgi:hypothetical protein
MVKMWLRSWSVVALVSRRYVNATGRGNGTKKGVGRWAQSVAVEVGRRLPDRKQLTSNLRYDDVPDIKRDAIDGRSYRITKLRG